MKTTETTKPATKINTLDELYKMAGSHQVTAQEVINGRTYVNGEWQAVEFSDELQEQVISKIIESASGRGNTPAIMRRALSNSRPQHWAIARFLLCQYGNNSAHFSYCAGQDMVWEMRELRRFFTK